MCWRGNLWGNSSAAWCDELEPHTGKGADDQERRLALGGIQPIDCDAVFESLRVRHFRAFPVRFARHSHGSGPSNPPGTKTRLLLISMLCEFCLVHTELTRAEVE